MQSLNMTLKFIGVKHNNKINKVKPKYPFQGALVHVSDMKLERG